MRYIKTQRWWASDVEGIEGSCQPWKGSNAVPYAGNDREVVI